MKYADDDILKYLEGDLDQNEAKSLEAWAQQDPDGRKRLEEFRKLVADMENSMQVEPPERLDWEFQSALADEIGGPHRSNAPWLMWAAAIGLLLVGFMAGVGLKSDPGEDLTALQGQVADLQEVVMMSVLQDHTASERIQVVNNIEDFPTELSEDLMTVLINTLSTDDSPNVRYAAVQALTRYIHLDRVRMELVRALEQQTDPLIQIAMISLLVEAEEKSAIAPMKRLLESDGTSEEVRRQAGIAIDILI